MSNGRIAVLCPSRGRPTQLKRLLESVRKTSEAADVLVYIDTNIDESERSRYQSVLTEDLGHGDERTYFHHGPQLGPVRSTNALAAAFPDYSAYGMLPDDYLVLSPGWDRWCLSCFDRMPSRIGVVSPYAGDGTYVDVPFVSDAWVKRLGWFAPPLQYHFGWTAILGTLGECTSIVHANADQFATRHIMESTANATHLTGDKDNVYAFFTYYVYSCLRQLRGQTG